MVKRRSRIPALSRGEELSITNLRPRSHPVTTRRKKSRKSSRRLNLKRLVTANALEEDAKEEDQTRGGRDSKFPRMYNLQGERF